MCFSQVEIDLLEGEINKKKSDLLNLVSEFIRSQKISCETAAHQDWSSDNDLTNFIVRMCNIVGYYEVPADA